MRKQHSKFMPDTLFQWVISTQIRWQIILLGIILLTVVARVIPLEMQKRIINQALEMKDISMLMTYCGIYLGSVFVASSLKFAINMIQSMIGQTALRQMRIQLFDHILKLPLGFFRKAQPGMVVSFMVSELASAGDFIGMALSVPLVNLLTLLAFAGYLFWLNPLLATISMMIYPAAIVFLPRLQKKANLANESRIKITREFSSMVSESISGIHEIQGHGADTMEVEKCRRFATDMHKAKLSWDMYKFGVKVSNNLLVNLGPFIIFIVGGGLIIQGKLELGALVAFLSAQEKLYDPWKELINFYQTYQDARVRYHRTLTYFDQEPDFFFSGDASEISDLEGALDVEELTYEVEGGIRLLDNVSFSLKPGEHLAIIGYSGSGKSTLAKCVAQLYRYQSGRVRLDDREIADVPKPSLMPFVGIVPQTPYIFSGTIRENLLYSFQAASRGLQAPPSTDDLMEILQQTGLFTDVLRFGLQTTFDKDASPRIQQRLIQVRQTFLSEFSHELANEVEFYDPNQYLFHSDVSENLIFGAVNEPQFEKDQLVKNSLFIQFLTDAQLMAPLTQLGLDLAWQVVDILGNLPEDSPLFQQSPILPEDVPNYKSILAKRKSMPTMSLDTSDTLYLLKAALNFIPSVHKIAVLTDTLQNRILSGRKQFQKMIRNQCPESLSFYHPSQYIHSQSVLNNILFGKLKQPHSGASEKVNQKIIQLLIHEDFFERIVELGLEFQVGSQGDNLSGGQQQKLAIARVLLKKPNLIILDEATSALDNASQARITRILKHHYRSSTILSVIHRLDIITDFDRVAVMKSGKIVEMGTYRQLMDNQGIFHQLITGVG